MPTDAAPTTRTIATVSRTTTARVCRLALLDLVGETKRFADARSNMPILATTLLSAGDEALRVAATDLQRTVDGKLRATVSTAQVGSLTDLATALEESARVGLSAPQSFSLPLPAVGVDAKKLHEVVKALPSTDVEVLFQERLTLTETDTFRANKTRVCSVCRKRSVSVSADGTCIAKPSHAAKLPCGGKLLETSRDLSHVVEVSLLSGKSRFNLRSLRGVDFPKWPTVDARLWHRVDAAILREVLEKVAPTISQDSTRSHLNGALLEIGDGLLRGVSTDGHRLTKCDRAIVTTMSTRSTALNARSYEHGFVLPLLGVTELLKFLPGLIGKPKKGVAAQCDVELALTMGAAGPTYCHWRKPNGDAVYTQRLEAAQFPPYDQVIPRDVEKTAVANRADLLAAVKRMMISALEKPAGLKLTLQGSEDGGALQPVGMRLSTDNPDIGDASEDLDGVVGTCCYEWQRTTKPNDHGGVDKIATLLPFVFGINGRYLVAALEEMTSTTVHMGFNGELDPITLQAAAGDADVVVIMPMRL